MRKTRRVIRHELYLLWAHKYADDAMLFIADFRDTFFQADPFQNLRLDDRTHNIMFFAEHFPFKQFKRCPFNAGWVGACWGKSVISAMRDSEALCSGSYLGTKQGIIHFEETFMGEVDSAQCHVKNQASDQGYVNYLYYTGRVPKGRVYDRGYSVVNTVGAVCPGLSTVPIDVCNFPISMENGLVRPLRRLEQAVSGTGIL